MRLFHFTSEGHLPHIIASGGLCKGDVIVGQRGEKTLTATWLSLDPDPDHQGLGDGTATLIATAEMIALGMPATMGTVDKRAVRITVVIPSTDRRLRRWLPFARGGVGEQIIDFEKRHAGNPRFVEDWFFYRGVIPVERFASIEIRAGDGPYEIATPERIAAIEPHEIEWTGGVPEADWEH
ncbi:hypothetical protein [Enterovirga aerilata]|uniref:DUF4433 domain-containing protein n=1 Tax=Enterovirga aerilata TaxID=2730920 RepID=A0A849I327_9HYPH|nr:hypothetical protein [Enterovirga sp. DB1703]NNM74206.1 hypothetical protein [Enterovirga sp. DB1703]